MPSRAQLAVPDILAHHDIFIRSFPPLHAGEDDVHKWLDTWYHPAGNYHTVEIPSLPDSPRVMAIDNVHLRGVHLRALTQKALESYLRGCKFSVIDAEGIAIDVERAKVAESKKIRAKLLAIADSKEATADKMQSSMLEGL